MEEAERSRKVKKEIKRLCAIYGDLADEKKSPVSGLIPRAAYLRVQIEEIEEDLTKNGYVEMFKQGSEPPYERQRPAANLLKSYNETYSKILKQLSDLKPPEVKKDNSDSFDDFARGRGND